MSKLDDISIWIEANRDVPSRRWEDEIWPHIEKQIKDLFLEVLDSPDVEWEQFSRQDYANLEQLRNKVKEL